MRATRYISTLTGSTFINFVHALLGNKPPLRYYPKLSLSAGISMLISSLAPIEKLLFKKQVSQVNFNHPPVFIIGHWRSGTTYLHNLLSQDKQFAYFTTYQSLFPHTALLGRHIFKPFVKRILPKSRPVDHIKLSADYPQEEEFALGNMNPYCFYYWWYFPERLRELFCKYMLFEDVDSKVIKRWKHDYQLLASKAILNTKGKILLSKNPPNSTRIGILNELFPGARFIHIHRNPVEVYCSTKKFFLQTLPDLTLKNYNESAIIDDIFFLYENVMRQIFKQKSLIKDSKFRSVSYDDLLQNPLHEIEIIYKQFDIGDFNHSKRNFQKYLQTQITHQTGKYSITQEELDRILDNWGFVMEKLSYKVSSDISVQLS